MFTPLRMCVGCRKMLPKENLVRLVRNKETLQIQIDESKKMQGRGMYVCKEADCIRLAQKKKALERSFKCSISAEFYAEIERSVTNG